MPASQDRYTAGERGPKMPLSIPLTTFAIALIYYSWRDGYYWRLLKDKSLRERVAYMLWTAAQH